MKISPFKIGSLYKVKANIFAYEDNPLETFQRLEYGALNLTDAFIILDYNPHSEVKNIFLVKILIEDKIKYIISADNNLIEIKEE